MYDFIKYLKLLKKNKFKLNKKTIGPIVAISLMLIVTVFGFSFLNGWFSTFNSNFQSKAIIQSNINSIKIEGIYNDQLNFRKYGSDEIQINNIIINNYQCNISGNYSGLISINISSCLTNLDSGNLDITLLSNSGFFSTTQYYEIIPRDKDPDQFNFTNQINVNLNTVIISNTIIPTGFDAETNVKINGTGNPQFSINGGIYTNNSNFTIGDNITLRLTSSSNPLTTNSATLSIGGISTIWNVTTKNIIYYTFTSSITATSTNGILLSNYIDPASADEFVITVNSGVTLSGKAGANGANGASVASCNSYANNCNGQLYGSGTDGTSASSGGYGIDFTGFSGKIITIINNGIIKGGDGGIGGAGGPAIPNCGTDCHAFTQLGGCGGAGASGNLWNYNSAGITLLGDSGISGSNGAAGAAGASATHYDSFGCN